MREANIDALHFESNQDWRIHLLLGLEQTSTPAQHSLIPHHVTTIAELAERARVRKIKSFKIPGHRNHTLSHTQASHASSIQMLVQGMFSCATPNIAPPQNSATSHYLRLKVKGKSLYRPFFSVAWWPFYYTGLGSWFRV